MYAASFVLCVIVLLALLMVSPVGAAGPRDHGGYYTAERLANLRANCEKYEWAQGQRQNAVSQAAFWVKMSDEALWQVIPGQKLPRCIDVSYFKGKRTYCLKCGEALAKHGNYPYSPDHWARPWKLECPSCHVVFPTNDFGKYYQSGLDETGVFNPEKADRSLLFNTAHPDPSDPLHKYGVDDGYGFFDAQGNRHLFIGYYGWILWNRLVSGVKALAHAYLYTGDPQYSRKALIMLDRIADLYPSLDWREYGKLGYYHSDGGSGKGKIGGAIWETGIIQTLARCVDICLPGTVDDPALYAFLSQQAQRYQLPRPKGTRELLVQNLDDGLLRQGAQAIYDGQAAGNEGMNQSALAQCAIALDTDPDTTKWLDYLFEAKGEHIPTVIVGGIDRDGVGAEAAPGYALSWGVNIGETADLLADYGKYTKHDIYRDFPSFKATFTAGWRIGLLGYASPNIGDSGSCGSLGLVAAEPNFIVRGYKYLKDPAIALAAYYANGEKATGLGRDIYAQDPEWVEKDITRLVAEAGPRGNPWQGGHNMAGYGLGSVEFGWGKPGVGLWMYYGRNGGHGHLDRLNFDLYYQGFCMLPEHGYPEFTGGWPQRGYVTRNTLSHNTVVVNGLQQKINWVGHPETYCHFEDFGALRVDSREMYDGVRLYQRTMALVKVGEGEAYAFDVFRVAGGNDHLYSLHGLPGALTATGLNLTKQEQGTLAGPDIPFATQTPLGPGYGNSWVAEVERDSQPAGAFTLDWKGQAGYRGLKPEEDLHLRYHSLTDLNEVVLGNMQPPQNRQGAPQWLRYLFARRVGADLTSTFAGIVEPYSQSPVLKSVERLPLVEAPASAQAVAVKVTLADGAVDYLMASNDDRAVIKAAGGLEWSGAVGWLRVREGLVERAALTRGTRLSWGSFALQSKQPGHGGKIVKMDQDSAGEGHIWVDQPLPLGKALQGQQIIIANDRVRNACYEIQSVTKDGEFYRVSLGEVSFIRDFKAPKDYTQGYVYEFAEGAEFLIPLTAWVARGTENTYRLRSNMEVELSVPVK